MRRRKLERDPAPLRRKPPKRMRHNTRSPTACQKGIWRSPNSSGISQFHSCLTISPPAKMNSARPSIARGAKNIIRCHLGLIFTTSRFHELVVNVLQPLAQMQHCIALAREQRIHADTALLGHFLEASSFDLVPDEDLPLLFRQLLEGQFLFLQEQVAKVEFVGPGIR